MKESRKLAMNHHATEYIRTGDVQAFESLYKEFLEEYGSWFKKIAQNEVRSCDTANVRAHYEDALLYALKKHTPEKNFTHLFLWMVKKRKINMIKKQRFEDKNTHTEIKKETEDAPEDPITNLQEDFNLEQQTLDTLANTELTRFFFDNAPDAITRRILEEIPKHETLNGVAKTVGLQLIQVQRKLEKLRALYAKSTYKDVIFFEQ